MKIKRRLRVLFFLSAAAVVIAPFVGARALSLADVLAWGGKTGGARIFWELRLPRVLLAWFCGATLGLCGMIFQALFRNPLAEPTMLGVASGASFGAAFCIYMGWNVSLFGFSAMAASSFVGAFACVLALQCAAGLRPDREGATLLLAGVAFNFFFSSLVMILQYMGTYNDSFRLLRWTLGGIQVIGLGEALRLAPVFVLAAAVSFASARELDLLLCGPEMAVARGMELVRARRVLFLAVSFCVALSVAFCGPVAFVGLMVPHLCRLVVGSLHRNLAAASIFFGGAFLVLCDTASRTLWSPMELPVGIITSFLGAPFFLWLLLRK
ncbi:MAG: iron ABC transporter permease [Synergistaceae bacterium]|jgi:iron complex transport system permease protein|nr:iron ABC transporter permease [Synergistaceae bacterium]